MSRIAQILAVCAAAVLCPSAAAGGGFPRFGAGCSRADFRSGGANIRAEFCRATGGGRAAVIVLHGCGGFSTGAFGAEALASRLPPTILLSGGSTDAIPIQDTRPLYAALRAAHVPSELYVYPHGSHAWPGRQGALGISRAAAFLRRYLG